ncbi:MAG TPA: inositol monophosphatase family protein [Mycobacteriales bacterium]|nr:inositol monophosphatase family protein [Mycobacteriales bacterium]
MTPDPVELLSIASDLARSAGQLLRRRPADLGVDAKSTPTDAVTVMDKAAEDLILSELTRTRPEDGVVGEEGTDRPGRSGVTWVIDPLDGTVNYLYGIPHYAVSVAAEVEGAAVAGAVYDVARGQLYTASIGAGARCDGVPLRCTSQADPAFALVGTGFAYAARTRAAQAQVLRSVLPEVRDIRRAGSAALDLCAVAAGQLDGFFEAGMNHWDWAAGALIATEAGARAGGVGGRPPGTWTTLVANPVLFDRLDELLRAAGADRVGVEG